MLRAMVDAVLIRHDHKKATEQTLSAIFLSFLNFLAQ